MTASASATSKERIHITCEPGATGINYLGHTGAGPWVKNESGVGMLSFWKLPIAAE